MGNVLLSRAGEQLRMDDGLLAEYREATLHRAAECWEALKTDFQDNVKLTGEQFDEVGMRGAIACVFAGVGLTGEW